MSSLPPMEQLRFFDAAARHLSFQEAAAELCVSPAAVSQRIRALEALLDTPLFIRHTRRVSLTRAGKLLADKSRQAFTLLHEGIDDVRQLHHRDVFTISTTTTFAEQFLMSKMDTFQQLFPETDSRILVSNALVDFRYDKVDVAVRQGLGNYAGCHTRPVGNDGYIAVATRQLADDFAAGHPVTLITVDWPERIQDFPCWNQWFGHQALPRPYAAQQLNVPTEAMAVRAALNGQGMALIHGLHIQQELQAGTLVRLFGDRQRSLPSPYRYYLVWPTRGTNPVATAFCDWISAQLNGSKTPMLTV